jgi:hypothetical protein
MPLPLYPLEKSPVPMDSRLGEPQSHSRRCEVQKISFPYLESVPGPTITYPVAIVFPTPDAEIRYVIS